MVRARHGIRTPREERSCGAVSAIAPQPTLSASHTLRFDAKRARDYPASDLIRDQLNAMGVAVDDNEKTWRVRAPKGLLGTPSSGYRRVDDTVGVQVDESLVNQMLADRGRARMARDYAAADKLQDKLTLMGIVVDDKAKNWKVHPAMAGATLRGDGKVDSGGGDGGPYGPPAAATPDLASDLATAAKAAMTAVLSRWNTGPGGTALLGGGPAG
eukprot:4807396-Prymnesium_polylepis.1